jgi:hypothetical protein
MKTALTIAMLSLSAMSFATSAHAYDVETGSIMLCDTQKQIERYVQLFDGNRDDAIKAVNTEESNPTACAMTNVAYVQGETVAVARSASDGYKVMQIAVVAVNAGPGYQLIKPSVFYTLVKLKEQAV